MANCRESTKQDPFLRKLVGSEFKHVAFEDLTVSTATIDVRLVSNANIAYEELFDLLLIDEPFSKGGIKLLSPLFTSK